MEHWDVGRMTPFDRRVMTESLLLTKLIIPYLPRETQRAMAIYVKWMELKNVWRSFPVFSQNARTAQDILQELQPYMPSSAFDSIGSLMDLLSMMESMRDSGMDCDGGPFPDPMAMMQSMFSSGQEAFTSKDTAQEKQQGGETNA